jgi:WD40 repeat protein
MRRGFSLLSAAVLGLGAVAVGCGGRPAEWDTPVSSPVQVGSLRNAAVLIDSSLNRALVVQAVAEQNLVTTVVPVGKRIALTATSPDRKKVFVLSQGEEVRLRPTDEEPALTVFDADHPETPSRYTLPDPLTSLAIDPTGQFAIVYAGDTTQSAFLTNPNEIVFIDLTQSDLAAAVQPRTLPSKEGGAPNRLTFSPKMSFPGGDRRFLIVETDRDLLLLDIDHPTRGEVTLPLTDPHTDSRALSPAGIAIDPGDKDAKDVDGNPTPRAPAIALRTSNDDNVLVYTLEPSETTAGGNDFHPHPNFAPAGGVPSDIAFVKTKQGVRLSVIVPTPTPRGLLVNVDDNQTMTAKFAQGYQRLSLVTDVVSKGSPDGDQVLLWSGGNASSVALWDLGAVPSAAQADIDTVKSIETLNLNGSVVSVTDVNNDGYQNLKVLQTASQSLYVLDLKEHQASPLRASSTVTIRLGLQDDRAWAFQGTQTNLAKLSLGSAHVQSVIIDRPIDDVLEIDRKDNPDGKALLAFHNMGNAQAPGTSFYGDVAGITVFDALNPEAATSRRYSSVMLERLVP